MVSVSPPDATAVAAPVLATNDTRTRKKIKAARIVIKETNGLEARLHPSLSLPSHIQVANVIAKCLSLQSDALFHAMFNTFRPLPFQKQKKRQHITSVPAPAALTLMSPSELVLADDKICNTPILWIDSSLRHAFGDDFVILKRCNHPHEMYSCGETHSDLDLVIMDCVLSQSSCPINKQSGKQFKDHAAHAHDDTPVQVCTLDDVDAINIAIAVQDGTAFNYCPSGEMEYNDSFYRACIVLLPQARVFYCHREQRSRFTGLLNSHVPMDLNWLRIQADSDRNYFGNGSYVSRLANENKCSIWKWSIRRSATNLLPFPSAIMGLRLRSSVRPIHSTSQLTDEQGPGLPLDFIVGDDDELMLNADLPTRTKMFQDAFSRSRSAKRGCRHYAPGFLHKMIDPLTTFVIDPSQYGDIDLQVDVTIPLNTGEVAFHRCSVIQIRYLPSIVGLGCQELLADINTHCDAVTKQRGGAGARAGNGDLGAMYPIGRRINESWNTDQYVTTSGDKGIPVLLNAVQSAAKLASVTIPAALRVMQNFENDSGMKHVHRMDGGICSITHSMDLSDKLANSSHYDVNDASQGFTIWTEDNPNTTQEWYFVLPNMKGKFPGTDSNYNGIAIKLSHGVLIGWDGRLIRHGTSMVGSRVGNIYGTFFAPKTRIIMYGMSQLQENA